MQAVVRKTGARFGTVKVGFDLVCAALACLCAFLFVGHLAGVREGTFVCAAFTGVIVNVYMGLYGQAARRRPQTAQRDGEAFRRRAAGAPPQQKRRRRQGRKKRHCRPIVQQGDVSGQE